MPSLGKGKPRGLTTQHQSRGDLGDPRCLEFPQAEAQKILGEGALLTWIKARSVEDGSPLG